MRKKKKVFLKFNLGDVVNIKVKLFEGDVIIEGKVVGTSMRPKTYLIKLSKSIHAHSFPYDKTLLRAWTLKTFKAEFLLEELIEGDEYLWTHILSHRIWSKTLITKVKIISTDSLVSVLKEIRNEINSK